MDAQTAPGAPPSASKTYHQFSRFYEAFAAPFYTKRILDTIESLNIPAGARVLEIGVGTGISLPAYPPHARVVGIDLSDDMLKHAEEKIEEHHWNHIEVRQMDALRLKFPDKYFDYVMAFHVVTVVEDIDRLMHEIHRVCKPGGTVVIINHLRSQRRWLAAMMDRLNPVTRRLGWRTDLPFEKLIAPVSLAVKRRYKTSPWSLFTIMIATRSAEAPRSEAEQPQAVGT